MKMSCNGCRVLRKGCNEGCIIRHCIQWIPNAEAQGNATLFLAKIYGRAGLLNLITAGPPHLRPEIFKSLLYEACGRIINPINGSVGLQWMNQWHYCEAGVSAVLNGYPIVKLPHDHNTTNAPYPFISLQNCDIRHIPKEPICNIHDDPNDDGKAKTSVLIKHDKDDAFASDSNSDFAFEHDKLNENHQVNNGELSLRDYFREESLETSLDIGVGTSRRRRVKRKLSLSARREVGRELALGRKPE